MYSVSKKRKGNNKELDNFCLVGLDGFVMSSKSGIKVNNQIIRDIKVVDKDFAHVVVFDKVMAIYQKLIDRLTTLITSDDDSGSDLQKALNEIEKFRLQIKNKYRYYLKQKELEKMSHELKTLKKEAEKRIIEMNQNTVRFSNNRSR